MDDLDAEYRRWLDAEYGRWLDAEYGGWLDAEYRRWLEWERARRAEPVRTCPRCDGEGFIFGSADWVICPVCDGCRMIADE